MIYTTYLANAKNIPSDSYTEKYFIARYAPLSLPSDVRKVPELGPPHPILMAYKKGKIDWDKFKKEFMSFLENDVYAQRIIDIIVSMGQLDRDVYLICYEKDNTHCHRKLLAEYIKKEYDIECKEFKKGD